MLCGFGKSQTDQCNPCDLCCANDNSMKDGLMEIDPDAPDWGSITGGSMFLLNDRYELEYTSWRNVGSQEKFKISLLRDDDTLCTKEITVDGYNCEPFRYCNKNGELIVYIEFYVKPRNKSAQLSWPALPVRRVWQRSEA